VQKHFASAAEAATRCYWTRHEDRHARLRDLGRRLRTGIRRVTDAAPDDGWKWRVDYTAFRDPARTDASIAMVDGIIEVRIHRQGGRETATADLFNCDVSASEPDRAAPLLLALAPASFQVLFDTSSVLVHPVARAVANEDAAPQDSFAARVGRAIARCAHVRSPVTYDAKGRRLLWRAWNGLRVAVPCHVAHRIRVTLRNVQSDLALHQLIDPAELSAYPMTMSRCATVPACGSQPPRPAPPSGRRVSSLGTPHVPRNRPDAA
jgi:hypothetical protein